MKGKSIRRREKNALAAKSANLYKAQFGKASKWDALPAPPEEQEPSSTLPRSTRKIAEFMRQQSGSQSSTSAGAVHQARKKRNKFKVELHADEAGTPAQTVTKQDEGPEGGDSRKRGSIIEKALNLHAQVRVPKGQRTKAKRKQVLDDKKRLKKLRRQVAQADTLEDEVKADDLQHDNVAFGEVAHAPPKAMLKRRHWDEAQAAEAHQARHKAVLLKNLRRASEGAAQMSAEGAMQAQRDQAVRDRVQGAYRKMKGWRTDGANMHSLKQLVH